MNALEVLRYIQRRMKVCKVPEDANSCDTVGRITHMAERALNPGDIFNTKERFEDLHFQQFGDVWHASLKRI